MFNAKKKPAPIWDRLHQWLHIDISLTDITVLRQSGVWSRRSDVLHRQNLDSAAVDAEDLLIAQLRLALQAADCAYHRATITLPDSLVRMWLVTPPANAISVADCKGAAAMRFHALFGEFAGEWEIVADLDAVHPFLACAVRRSLLTGIVKTCTELHIDLMKLEPHFVRTWNQFHREIGKDAWVATLNYTALDHATLTLGAIQAARLVALRSIKLPPDTFRASSWLHQHIQREALLLDLTPPKKVQISGAIPAQWLKNEDGKLQCQPLGPVTSLINSARVQPEMVQKGVA